MLEPTLHAISYLSQPTYWFALSAALGLAALAGLIPGVNSTLVMAIAIPLILFEVEEPAIGLVMLATITGVDNTLDSIPAILYGQPGAATQVTFLEGHQLARQGKAAHTLGAVYVVSALGGIVGALALLIAIPVIRPFILKFGFSEIAALALAGITMISVLSQGAILKGFIAAITGMLIATIGTDPITGTSRLTVGPLFELPLIPLVLGLFALPEMIDLTASRQPVAPLGARIDTREVIRGAREGIRHWRIVIRQSLLGVFLGVIPGVGSAVIDWLSYAFGVMLAKDKKQFGTGSLEGVIFAESAQNAKEGGQAIPSLAMGIPGGPAWAIVLTGMVVYGIAPGPHMVSSLAHITILLVLTLAIGNLAITMIGLVISGHLARLTQVPYPVLGSIIIPLVLLAGFLDTYAWRGVQVVLCLGGIGLVMKWLGWPRPPLLLGFILGPIAELNFQSGLSVYGLVGMAQRPITVGIVLASGIAAVVFARSARKTRIETAGEPDHGTSERHLHRRSLRPFNYAIAVLIALTGIIFAVDSAGYPSRSVPFPFSLSVVLVALCTASVFQTARAPLGANQIMDLGLVSTGRPGSSRAWVTITAMMLVFVITGIAFGLREAAITFGVIGPMCLMNGRSRWALSMLTGMLVFIFIFVVLDNVLFVMWPSPLMFGWIPYG